MPFIPWSHISKPQADKPKITVNLIHYVRVCSGQLTRTWSEWERDLCVSTDAEVDLDSRETSLTKESIQSWNSHVYIYRVRTRRTAVNTINKHAST